MSEIFGEITIELKTTLPLGEDGDCLKRHDEFEEIYELIKNLLTNVFNLPDGWELEVYC